MSARSLFSLWGAAFGWYNLSIAARRHCRARPPAPIRARGQMAKALLRTLELAGRKR